jgi:TonB family protein
MKVQARVFMTLILVCVVGGISSELEVVPFFKLKVRPQLLYEAVPEYPQEAREQGHEGTAIVEATVGLDGSIVKSELVKSSDHPELDTAALDAALKWKFSPAEYKRRKVGTIVTIPFNFNLSDWESLEEEPETSEDVDSVTVDSTEVKKARKEPDTIPSLPLRQVPPMSVEEVDNAPQALNTPQPEYPEELIKQGVKGKVILDALVDTDGTVVDIKVKESSGFEQIDKAAVDAAYNWTFTPAEYKGKPVQVWFPIPFSFGEPVGFEGK